MKQFIAYFIKYPVAVNICVIGFVIFGILGYLNLNSSIFPLSESKTISITVNYPGASPEEVEEGVIEKIEKNLKGISGIDRVTSVSEENLGTITIELLEGFNINIVLDDVKNAVDRIPSFPANIEPPVVEKVENRRESIVFVVTGDDVPLSILKKTAEDIEEDLLAFPGLSQVTLSGFPEEEIEIALLEDNLRRYNLSFEDVASAVTNSNIIITGGSIKTNKEEYLIRADNKEYYSRELNHIVVKSTSAGTLVYLRDVATISDTFSETPDRVYYNGKQSIQVGITNTNNEDLIKTADRVKEYISQYNQKNDNIELIVTFDTSLVLKGRISLLLENATVGMFLVFLLLSIFLRPNLAIWVAFGLPISFLGMFVVLSQFGVTINMLSLFGMIIVIGILVDDGIVIAENIYSKYEAGNSAVRSAVRGTLEVLTPILSAITTTILAFAVFYFLEGNIGAFFSDIATVVTLTLAISLIEALLILPAHLAHSKDLTDKAKVYKINVYGDKLMSYMKDRLYSPAFKFALRYKFLTFSIAIFFFVVTIAAFASGVVTVTFFPANASDQIVISLETPKGTNEAITDSGAVHIQNSAWRVNQELGPNLEGKPQILNVLKQLGPGSAKATLIVNLSPGETRELSSPEITDLIRQQVGELSGVEKLSFNSGANIGGSPVSVSLQGRDIEQLNEAKQLVYEELRSNPKVKDIIDSSPKGIKEINLTLKDNAQILGLSLNDVMRQVRNAFFGNEAQRLQRGENEVKVWVRYARQNRSSLNDINDIEIVTQNGRVPLSEIATYTIERGDVAINHLDGVREVTVDADMVNPKESAASVMQKLRTEVAPEIETKYPGVSVSFEGQNREVGKIASSAGRVLPAVIFLIYVVIVFAFRSYSQPFILLALIPLGIIGVALGHWIHGFPVNVLSMLGVVALLGIVVNDGLVFTGKFNSFLKEGLKFEEALYETGRSRFRAIFLTSITTIAGLAPLILEKSFQAQFLIPMAISIAYGIAIATLMTLFILPIFLAFSNSIKVNFKYLLTGTKPERESVERAIKELSMDHEQI
ncbi:MAG: efflux RND transporter permease subunit [Bacteroidota bacterium]